MQSRQVLRPEATIDAVCINALGVIVQRTSDRSNPKFGPPTLGRTSARVRSVSKALYRVKRLRCVAPALYQPTI